MEIYIADAFTSVPFSGNPAAVCLLRQDISTEKKQCIASEMNLSETAFVLLGDPSGSGDFLSATDFNLQWFTPTCEVPLCGHATLATSAVLFDMNPSKILRFSTLSGVLTVTRDEQGSFMNMEFPLASMTLDDDWEDVKDLVKVAVGQNKVKNLAYSSSTKKLLVHLDDSFGRENLESLSPDTKTMLGVHSGRVRGVIVTIKGDNNYDFYSRYFAPWNGIPEDPVTGSAHTFLARYWSQLLEKNSLFARQCSKRGGDVRMKILDESRVQLAGQACIVMKGKLSISH